MLLSDKWAVYRSDLCSIAQCQSSLDTYRGGDNNTSSGEAIDA